MSTWFPIVFKKLRQSKWIYKFTFGALSAVVGPIIVTTFKLGQTIDVHWGFFALSIIAFWLSLKNKLPVWGLIPLSGGCFLLIHLLLF
jgi:chromate transport protein ChrA